jgi:hypothetical protein
MIWLIVTISINGALPQVAEKIRYEDMQSCQAEKAVRDHRQDSFAFPHGVSVNRNVVCLGGPEG